MKEAATISGLVIYPIKSCRGIPLEKAIVTKYGLASFDNPSVMDRKWMIIDENNTFISQRTVPKMALIKPEIDGDFLGLTAPNMDNLKVPIEPPKNKRESKCKDSMVETYVYGGDVAKWLSDFLGLKVDLVSYDKEFTTRRLVDMKKNFQIGVKDTDTTLYADYSQFMLMSEGALADLNTRTPFAVTFSNFRPNIIVKDCDNYAEDNWLKVKIGNVTFRKTRNCTRCQLTTVNPETGVKDPNQEPLNTLRKYRVNSELYGPSPLLGINLVSDIEKDSEILQINDKLFNIDEN